MKLVLAKLAHFHAATYHMIRTYPGGLEAFKTDYEYMNCKVWMIFDDQVMEEKTWRILESP